MCDTEDVVIENEYLEVLNDPENPNLELGLALALIGMAFHIEVVLC